MDIKRISDENLYGKPCGLNHCSVSVMFQFFLCTWEINSFICQSLTWCPLIINPIRKWFRVQGFRGALLLLVYWCLVLWTVRTTGGTHTGYSSKIWNVWWLKSALFVCIGVWMSVEILYIMIPVKSSTCLQEKEQLHYVNTCVCVCGGQRGKEGKKKKKRKGEKRGWNKEGGQLERQESVAPASDSSIFNDASVSSCYTTLLLPHLLSTLSETHKPSQL